MYKENPKTKGSGVVCCIPQTGVCPVGCSDCFFQSGRSFLEPLDDNLPNMPVKLESWQILRVNDGHDSNVKRNLVMRDTEKWIGRRFFNTSFPKKFPEPYVLTVNPGEMTDKDWHKMEDVENLMFVRVRTNLWNLRIVQDVVEYYTKMLDRHVPVVLTFMAYFNDTLPERHKVSYEFRKRTLNSYWVMKFGEWAGVMDMFLNNPLVYSCSGPDNFACKNCGTCLREFHSCKEKMKPTNVS